MNASLKFAAGLVALGLTLSACSSQQTAPNSFPGALVDGDAIYLSRGQHVYKHTLSNGNEIWEFPAKAPEAGRQPLAGQPVKFGNTIIVGEGVGPAPRYLYALNAETGIEVWHFQRQREFVDGAVTDGKLIYVPNGDGALYALDPASIEADQPKIVWTFRSGNKLWSRPLLANGRLYQASMDQKLYALDPASLSQNAEGELQPKITWTFAEATAPIVVQPALADGVLYFGALDSTFYAVNAGDGSLRWKTKVDGWIWSDALVAGGKVIFGDVRGKVYALNAATGTEVWRVETTDSVRAQPIERDGTVYVVSFDTKVYALSLDTGAKKWANPVELKYRLPSKPVISGTNLIVPLFDSDTRMWALDASNGNRGIQYPPPVVTK